METSPAFFRKEKNINTTSKSHLKSKRKKKRQNFLLRLLACDHRAIFEPNSFSRASIVRKNETKKKKELSSTSSELDKKILKKKT